MIELMTKKGIKIDEIKAKGDELFLKAFKEVKEELKNPYLQMNFKQNHKTIGVKF